MQHTDLYTNDREARALLSYLTEPGDTTVGQMVHAWGLYRTLNGILSDEWDDPKYKFYLRFERAKVAEARKRMLPRLPAQPALVSDTLSTFERNDISFLIPGDWNYPKRLADLGFGAPWGLWVRGNLPDLESSVSIVGARASTSYGEHVTRELAADLAGTHVIVSGGAYGIDGDAHRAALAVGAQTVAFLAGGVDRMYPAGHADLGDRITWNGALVSEIPPGSVPTRWRFLQRNRLIAAATQGSVVVEAGWRSGSLNEASHAKALHRPVGAVPGPITSAASAGCHRLLAEFGATVITSAADVRAMIAGKPVQILDTEEVGS